MKLEHKYVNIFLSLVFFRAAPDDSQNEAILTALSQPSLSPFLCVEKSLQLFAERIAVNLHHLVSGSTTHRLSESIGDVLKPELKRIQVRGALCCAPASTNCDFR